MPADDYTDPAPATTFAHLDATTNLERHIAEKGIYPAVDPLASTSRLLAPEIVGEEHYTRCPQRAASAAALQGAAGHHRHSRYGRVVRRRQAAGGPGPQDRAVLVPADVRGGSVYRPAGQVRAGPGDGARASRAFSKASTTICRKRAFYMVGTIDEAVEKAKRMQEEAA